MHIANIDAVQLIMTNLNPICVGNVWIMTLMTDLLVEIVQVIKIVMNKYAKKVIRSVKKE